MDFSLDYTKEQEEFAKEFKEWLRANLPRNLELPADPGKLPEEEYRKLREFGRRLGERGWLAPTFPKEYGGGGLSLELAIVVELELDKYGIPLPPYYDPGLSLAAPSILVCGTEEQKQRFLPPILRGEVTTWQLFTEPEAGSDLAGVRTRAIAKDGKYIINGQKIFVGSTYKADWFWLLACSAPEGPRHRNLSMFIVPADLPGITIAPLDLIAAGEPGSSRSPGRKNTVFLHDVEVPEVNLIGGENNGWRVANATLEVEHGGAGSIRKDMTIAKLIELCRTDPHIKNRLKESPELLGKVIDIYISTEIERLFGMRNYWIANTRNPRTYEGNQYSLWRKLQGVKLASVSLDVLGPYALTTAPERVIAQGLFECWQRSGIVTAPAGSIEIQKVRMARALGIGRSPGGGAKE